MPRSLRLSLISPIYYHPASLTLSEAVSRADKKDIGYEAIIRYGFSFSDENLSLSVTESGERDGYSEEERARIENGEPIPRKEGEDISLDAGSYLFEQLPFIPDEKTLPRIILPYLTTANGEFFIRIYKENPFECVVQLLFPSP